MFGSSHQYREGWGLKGRPFTPLLTLSLKGRPVCRYAKSNPDLPPEVLGCGNDEDDPV